MTTLTTADCIAAIRAAKTRHIGSDGSALSTLSRVLHKDPIFRNAKGEYVWYYDRNRTLRIPEKQFAAWLARPARDGRPKKEKK